MTNLQLMYTKYGQSPWLDNISREMIQNGRIADLIVQGVRGLTSNPTIFEKALSSGTAYDNDIKALKAKGMSAEEIYWELAINDIQHAADFLMGVFTESNQSDGYVSLEVSPNLSQDSEATIKQAHQLFERVNRPNLMIKVPGTEACLPAIKQLIADGININITLIFSLERYQKVINAFISGLEQSSKSLNSIHSVASFFVSRIDTEVDKRIDSITDPNVQSLKGKTAVAQAQLAYNLFKDNFANSVEKWNILVKKNANIQRPLWASTSTKNPEYDPLLYIKQLLVSDSVSTIPDSTIDLLDKTEGSIREVGITGVSIESSKAVISQLNDARINMEEVTKLLEQEGLEKFQSSFESLLNSLTAKMNQ